MGRFANLHGLRQVRATGALTRKGTGVAEMEKDDGFLPYLTKMRENQS